MANRASTVKVVYANRIRKYRVLLKTRMGKWVPVAEGTTEHRALAAASRLLEKAAAQVASGL